MFSRAGVRLKFVVVGVAAVLVAVGATTTAVLWLMAEDLKRQANVLQDSKLRLLQELVARKGEVKVVEGRLKAGDHVINGDYEIVDRLQEISGGVATIFMNDQRVSTNVRKEDGSRAVGTLLQGPAREAVVFKGQSYRGEAEILGIPYFAAYAPIRDRNGVPLGVYFVGVKKSDFYQSYNSLVLFAVLIGIIMAAACGGVMTYAVGSVMKDVVVLTGAADRLSLGEGLENPIVLSRPDEIGALATSIERLRISLKAAMARIS